MVTRSTLKTYFQTGDVPTEGHFSSLIDHMGELGVHRAPNRGMVVAMVGDSNTMTTSGWDTAVTREWITEGGIFYGATVYNNGANGSRLAGWVDAISTKEGDARNPANGGTNNPWDVVAGDPDVVIVALGTNDLNSPSARSTDGTLESLRANLATLVNFFLENTRALIWLRLPHPLSWEGGSGAFDSLTQFASDDDCATHVANLRTAYIEWHNVPRVLVYDSHKHLFGYRCDDKTTDCLDPETGGPMVADGLHATSLGFRRIAQQMAQQWAGKPDRIPSYGTAPDALLRTAAWTITTRIRGRSTNLVSVDLDPVVAAEGYNATVRTANQSVSTELQRRVLDPARKYGRWSYQDLVNCTGPIYAYVHTTGNTYTFTSISFATLQTAGTPPYVDLTTAGASFVSNDAGSLVTFWGDDPLKGPFRGSRDYSDIELSIGASETSTSSPNPNRSADAKAFNGILATRGSTSGSPVIDIKECNQTDGRYVGSGTESSIGTVTGGRTICRIFFPASVYVGSVRWFPENMVTQNVIGARSFLVATVSSGTVAGGIRIILQYRGRFSDAAITSHPSNQSVAAGATATFSVTAASPSSGTSNYYQWAVSADSGATWTDISGANSASYTTAATVSGDNGKQYRCIVSTQANGVISNAATLTVT